MLRQPGLRRERVRRHGGKVVAGSGHAERYNWRLDRIRGGHCDVVVSTQSLETKIARVSAGIRGRGGIQFHGRIRSVVMVMVMMMVGARRSGCASGGGSRLVHE